MLEALVAAQGIDDVVNIVLQLAVREIQLLDCRVLVLEDKTMFLQLRIDFKLFYQPIFVIFFSLVQHSLTWITSINFFKM